MTTLPLYRSEGPEAGVFGDARPTIFRAQAFCSEWLRDQDLDSEHLAAMKMPGDAMRPTLSAGDIILIDTRRTDITDGRIHLITDHTRNRLLRRLQVHIGGKVRVLADNPDYQETMVNADQLTVLGLVVWRGAVLR
ncbi:Peptidase S24-like protein [compost metagenome]